MAINPCGPRKIKDIFADHGINLTNQEAKFLNVVLGRERLVSKGEIIETLWPNPDMEPLAVDHVLRVYTYRLKRKLAKSGVGWVLKPLYGRGFRLIYRK